MRRRGFLLVLALAATAVALVAPNVATAAPPNVWPGETLFITNIGNICPGFGAYFPYDPEGFASPGHFWLGYWGEWPVGEYLRFDEVTINAGPIWSARGSGGPVSDHTYRVIGRITETIENLSYGSMTIVRNDGATVSGDVTSLTDGNHGYLLTQFHPLTTACRLHR